MHQMRGAGGAGKAPARSRSAWSSGGELGVGGGRRAGQRFPAAAAQVPRDGAGLELGLS